MSYGICTGCKCAYKLRKDGNVRLHYGHNHPADWWCSGSGKPPESPLAPSEPREEKS